MVISAPKQEDSPHGHPHDDAIELYKKHVDEVNILHLGANLESVIVDIDADGNIEVKTDKELVEEYGKSEDDNDDNNNEFYKSIYVGSQTSRLDNKPMG